MKTSFLCADNKRYLKQLEHQEEGKQSAKIKADRSASIDDECSKYGQGHQLLLCNKKKLVISISEIDHIPMVRSFCMMSVLPGSVLIGIQASCGL